jgi:hypothetical protein
LYAYACYNGRVINLAKTGKEKLTSEAAAGGKVEADDWLLLTKDVPARCSRWSQVYWLLSLLVLDAVADKTKNGGPLVGRYCSSISCVAVKEGHLLLVLPLRLRNGVDSAGSITTPKEGYGCG